ncbi:MAG: hypothetical protein AB1540_01555 [Bdellovibrionota bacterium]
MFLCLASPSYAEEEPDGHILNKAPSLLKDVEAYHGYGIKFILNDLTTIRVDFNLTEITFDRDFDRAIELFGTPQRFEDIPFARLAGNWPLELRMHDLRIVVTKEHQRENFKIEVSSAQKRTTLTISQVSSTNIAETLSWIELLSRFHLLDSPESILKEVKIFKAHVLRSLRPHAMTAESLNRPYPQEAASRTLSELDLLAHEVYKQLPSRLKNQIWEPLQRVLEQARAYYDIFPIESVQQRRRARAWQYREKFEVIQNHFFNENPDHPRKASPLRRHYTCEGALTLATFET